jgi:glycosyltransferase involved in cell wall biosynthesis
LNRAPALSSDSTAVKTICYVHSGRASLPDIKAYSEYFSDHFQVAEKNTVDDLESYDILWFFMGWFRYRPRPNQYVVHEYSSLSVPPFARIKDCIKLATEVKPNLRVFQNAYQLESFRFNDQVPYLFRDMGVAEHFYHRQQRAKQYDLVYVGSMDRSRQLHKAIDRLLQLKPDLKVLMVGNAPDFLLGRYRNRPNISFVGAVDYSAVPALLSSASFGLNYVPDCFPYSIQSSTKLLEYYVAGLPVIGNMTTWCNQFIRENPMTYLDIEKLLQWPAILPELNQGKAKISADLLWHNRIQRAGFEKHLPYYF